MAALIDKLYDGPSTNFDFHAVVAEKQLLALLCLLLLSAPPAGNCSEGVRDGKRHADERSGDVERGRSGDLACF